MRQIGNALGYIDKRAAPQESQSSPSNADQITTPANLVDDAGLDARLTVINAAVYTAAVLSKMTQNDKVYAVRLNDEALGVV